MYPRLKKGSTFHKDAAHATMPGRSTITYSKKTPFAGGTAPYNKEVAVSFAIQSWKQTHSQHHGEKVSSSQKRI
jgi:hypothetical protein